MGLQRVVSGLEVGSRLLSEDRREHPNISRSRKVVGGVQDAPTSYMAGEIHELKRLMGTLTLFRD